jgi:hypothetical protein
MSLTYLSCTTVLRLVVRNFLETVLFLNNGEPPSCSAKTVTATASAAGFELSSVPVDAF